MRKLFGIPILMILSAFLFVGCAGHLVVDCTGEDCIKTSAYTGGFDPSQNLTTFYSECPDDPELTPEEKIKQCKSSQTFHATSAGALPSIVGAGGNAAAGIAVGVGLGDSGGTTVSQTGGGAVTNRVTITGGGGGGCRGRCD